MTHKKALFLILLVMLPLLVYLPTLKHELIWDSRPMILENDLLQGKFSLLAPFRSGYWAATSQRGSGYDYYRPLTVISFMAEKAVWGLDPMRLRLVNLLIFIAGLIFLYFFFSRQTSVSGSAETAVLIFALYPLHLDNITWVVGRSDLLMFGLGVFSIYSLDLFLEHKRVRYGMAAVAAYALALFSKEASLFFLPVFILFELSRRKRLTLPLHALFIVTTILFWTLKSAVIGRSSIPFHLFPSFLENGRILLGVLGYYFRSLVFPFRYDMFLPVNAVEHVGYVLAGFVFLFLMVLLVRLGIKKSQYLQAWIWIAPILAGYMMMVFTPIHPFSISTRYLFFPAIGCAWLLSQYLHSLPSPRRKIILVMLLFTQAAAIIGNAQKYRSETDFWASALRSSPHESFFLSQYAGQLRRDGDFIRSEILLRRALTLSMKNSTAVAVALQLADICRAQARYTESLGWLGKMRPLPLDAQQTNQRLRLLLKIHQSRGELAEAEKDVQAMAPTAPAGQIANLRMELYLAFAAWEKARAWQWPLDGAGAARIDKMQSAFQALPPREQAVYFMNRGNFACAYRRWPEGTVQGFAEQMQLARLAFLAGEEGEGKRRSESLAQKGAGDFRILNSLGNLFFDLQRADEALPFYQRSLRLNPLQPALRERLRFMTQ